MSKVQSDGLPRFAILVALAVIVFPGPADTNGHIRSDTSQQVWTTRFVSSGANLIVHKLLELLWEGTRLHDAPLRLAPTYHAWQNMANCAMPMTMILAGNYPTQSHRDASLWRPSGQPPDSAWRSISPMGARSTFIAYLVRFTAATSAG